MKYQKFKNRLAKSITNMEISEHESLLSSIQTYERYNLLDAISWGLDMSDIAQLPRKILKMNRESFQEYMFNTCVPKPY